MSSGGPTRQRPLTVRAAALGSRPVPRPNRTGHGQLGRRAGEAAVERDPRYKAGVTRQAPQALEPFRLPEIRRMCDVAMRDSLDPHEFLNASGTIWMLGSVSHQEQAARVCTALTAAIVEAARDLARETGRLRPPLLLAPGRGGERCADSAPRTAPVDRWRVGDPDDRRAPVARRRPECVGRRNRRRVVGLQQRQDRPGGPSDAQDLADISSLLGQREERVVQPSRSARLGVLEPGDHSLSWRQVPVMRPDEIRRIDSEERSHALLITQSGSGILLRQRRIYDLTPPKRPGGAS